MVTERAQLVPVVQASNRGKLRSLYCVACVNGCKQKSGQTGTIDGSKYSCLINKVEVAALSAMRLDKELN